MKKVRTNSGKVYDVYFRLKSENDETKEYSYYVYAVDEDHARQIVESYDADAVIYDTEEVSDAISQHYGLAINDYQHAAMGTCMDSSNNFSYMMLNLVGEVGEFASKVAKAIRKEQNTIDKNELNVCGEPLTREHVEKLYTLSKDEQEAYCMAYTEKNMVQWHEREADLQKEAGDILWQLAGLCSVMGWKLEDIAQQNLDKLASRKERNVIDGNGDNR